jgi:MFS family permease
MRASTAGRSAWSPFHHAPFAVIWTANVVSNVGYWMYVAAAGWLMTTLNPSPRLVSLVQVAGTLPTFLLALPAGAVVDIVDRRRFLILGESASTVFCAILAVLVWRGGISPATLLVLIFLVEAGSAMTSPAWQAVVPQLVPKDDLPEAVAANSVGFNLSRAVGPSLGGLCAAAYGIAAPFWINAVSNVGVLGALLWWHPPTPTTRPLPAEQFSRAIRTGLRHARYNAPLTATLVRAAAFSVFASAYWALLPLVARHQLGGDATLYGILLGAIGAGAIAGALVLPRVARKLGAERLVATGTVGTAIVLVLLAIAHSAAVAVVACVIAGMTWMVVLSNLNVSAQVALPDWVRGRGLSMYIMVFFGGMALGSAVWGEVASVAGLQAAHLIAAAGALLTIPLTRRWKVDAGAGEDLSPSMAWPAPILTHGVEPDRGPVLIAVEYEIDPGQREAFLTAIAKLADERRRDGAYEWDVFEDPAREGRFFEVWRSDSWLEHLRQHARVTQADRPIQEIVNRFQRTGSPTVTHLVAVSDDKA